MGWPTGMGNHHNHPPCVSALTKTSGQRCTPSLQMTKEAHGKQRATQI